MVYRNPARHPSGTDAVTHQEGNLMNDNLITVLIVLGILAALIFIVRR